MADERLPLTRSQRAIMEHAAKLGVPVPQEPGPDSNGFRRGSCLKHTLGTSNSPELARDDQAFLTEMRAAGYEITSSTDGMSWEFKIPETRFQANLTEQYQKGIAQTKPTRNQIVDPREADDGYYEVPETSVVAPVSIDTITGKQGPSKAAQQQMEAAINADPRAPEAPVSTETVLI